MDSYRIIISTSSLNIEVWTDLYRFIDSIYTNGTDENKIDALHCLKERCIQVCRASESNNDVYKLDGQELTDDALTQLSKNTSYSILYNKCDDLDDVVGLAHFIKFTQKFTTKTESGNYLSLVSLVIYTGGMENQEKASSFRSKCKDLFALIFRGIKPVLCNKSLISIFDNKIENKEGTTVENCESNNWLKRLYNDTSFPKAWQKEKYVNNTDNSPISSFNLMGVPQVNGCGESDHQKNLDRLYDIRNDLYKGHFEASNSHFRYFIDTESYVRRESDNEKGEFMEWIHELQGSFNRSDESENNKLNILITPKAESEFVFIHTINDKVFNGKALIVYLDINNKHASCVEICSFLKYLDKDSVRYHYVDNILFTGETYQRTKSILYSIIGDQDESTPNKDEEKQVQSNQKTDKKNNSIKTFDSVITVINHLSFTKDKEIKIDIKENLFAFINLYYPSSRYNSKDCQLCRLDSYYNKLSKETVLDNCQTIIQNYLKKIKLKNIKGVLLSDKKDLQANEEKRNFIRLVMTHELCYRLSQIAWGRSDFYDITRKDIYEELDSIYNSLLCNPDHPEAANHTKPNINERINKWFNSDFDDDSTESQDFTNIKLEIDKKISFLKVISSPPLSQYIVIREYAYSKLLCVLHEIINKKNENDYSYDDLKIVKSILKSLSFLKSNALVRKDVIVGVWEVLRKVINHLEKDIDKFENEINKAEKEIAIIDTKLAYLNTKTNLTISEEEIRIHLITVKNQEIKKSKQFNREKKCIEDLLTKDDNIIKDFSRDVQFFIKNAIVEDDAKATFLGELIRQGEEIHSSENISISKTKLSLKGNNQNILFEHFKNFKNETFRREYVDFLVWLFYDNTTIIRKTLNNFSRELSKNRIINLSFKYQNGILRDVSSFQKSVPYISKLFFDKINSESYYASFKPYLDNGDKFNYVNKLICVLYAKLKLEDIIYKHKTSIETDINDLLNVFSEIMGADAAFLIMKKDKKLYPISVYKKDDPCIEWNYEEWFLDDYYTRQILSFYRLVYPIIPLFCIEKHEKDFQQYGERYDFDAHSLNIYVMEYPEKTRVTISFLYNNQNPLTNDESTFRINIQESGRLLLLLKNDIDKYMADYLINEKVLDLWLEKEQNFRKYEKIYASSNHTFNSVYNEMEEFEKLNENIIRQSYSIWYFLANQTISFFYSHIVRNRLKGIDPMYCVTLKNEYIYDENNTLGKTFNEKFICILISLLDNRWNNDYEHGENTILINESKLQDFKLEETLLDVKMPLHKHLLRTFIVQCLNNSLGSPSRQHGHRTWGEIKLISITISKSFISIEDQSIKNVHSQAKRAAIAKKFEKKKKRIRQLNCDEYSSTTLTSLQGVIYNLNDGNKKGKYRCEYGFNDNYNFKVTFFF